ncbi:MAG: hypothetical protein K8M05_41550, partial [Deltaproteobacteria bacterium]|nr:hypothetical protein [Kofleriaceae bacterium]
MSKPAGIDRRADMADLHTSSFHARHPDTGIMQSRTMRLVCAALAAAFVAVPGGALAEQQPPPEQEP